MSLPATAGAVPRQNVALPARYPVRPPLRRPRSGRVIAGVCAGLAEHLGRSPRQIRVLMAALVLLNGAGVLLYLWLWALVPIDATPASVAAETTPDHAGGASAARPASPQDPQRPSAAVVMAQGPNDRLHPGLAEGSVISSDQSVWWRSRGLREIVLGLVLLLAVIPLTSVHVRGVSAVGVWAGIGLVAGAGLIYSQLDTVELLRWRAGPRVLVGLGLRVVVGLVMVLAALATLAFMVIDLSDPLSLLVALVAIIGGAMVVLAPWMIRLVRALGSEQQARVREQVRADMAAHLHDSVLQTLALIQRSNTDPAQVVRLARRQERDLRGYLYGAGPASSGTIAAAVRDLVDDIEDLHTVTIDLIMVGDGVVDDYAQALLAALREAMVNAARHAGGTVSVYVEVGADQVEAFVRDRGPGFRLEEVPTDRLGVRRSILARMQRHGGAAEIRSAPGEGTEVRLSAPVGVADKPADDFVAPGTGYGEAQAPPDERSRS